MNKRKILIITNRVPYPLRDGGNLAMQAMIEGYHRAGWEVFLLSMNTTRHHVSEEQLQKLFKHINAFEWMEVDNSINTVGLVKNFFFSRQPEHAKRFYSEEFEKKIVSVLHSFNPDVVQMESIYLSTYLPAIRDASGAICVLRMHNVEYQIWQGVASKAKNRIKQIYLNTLAERIRNFERAAWHEFDMLLPITEKDSYLVNRLEEITAMVVAPFGIDTSKIKVSTNERWVGYHIGAMDWIPNREGVQWFITHAFPRIRRSVPGFEFYFAGRKMPEDFKKLNVNGVHCMDEVADANEFIADKKILIVPISSSGGVRVKILEAMAAGKIVITTAKGVKGIDVKPGEHYLAARKPEDFEKAVRWCMEHPDAAERMAQNAKELITTKYEMSKVVWRVIEELENLLRFR